MDPESDPLEYSNFGLLDLKESQRRVRQIIYDEIALHSLPVNLKLLSIIFRFYELDYNQPKQYDDLEQLTVEILQDLTHSSKLEQCLDSKDNDNVLRDSLIYNLSSLVQMTKWSSKFGEKTRIDIIKELLKGPASLNVNEQKITLLIFDYAITTCCSLDLSKKVFDASNNKLIDYSSNVRSLVGRLETLIDTMMHDSTYTSHLSSKQLSEELVVDYDLNLNVPIESNKQTSKLVHKFLNDNAASLYEELSERLNRFKTLYRKRNEDIDPDEEIIEDRNEIEEMYHRLCDLAKESPCNTSYQMDYLSCLTQYLANLSSALAICKSKDLPFSRQFPQKLDFSILAHSLSPLLLALTIKNDLSVSEIVTLAEEMQSSLNSMNEEGEGTAATFEDLKIGIRLLKQLPDNISGAYMPLISKPKLIYEQMLMNREEITLKEAANFISYDDLVERYASKAIEVLTYDLSWNQFQGLNKSITGSHGDQSPVVNLSSANFNCSDTTSDITIISSFDPLNVSSSNIKTLLESEFVMPNTVPNKTDWIPDWKVSECMKCNEKYSLFNRRHHCRRCGRVVCGPCSNKHIFVQEISSRNPVRVCIDCYNQLRVQESRNSSSPDASDIFAFDPYMWILNANDEATNDDTRREFYYDCAPSVPLCLSILKLHSDRVKSSSFLIESICKPILEKLATNQSECGLLMGMVEPLLKWVKVSLSDHGSIPIVRTANQMLARVDLLRTLVNNNCNESIMNAAFKPDCAPSRLLEKLLEAEYFDSALELSTKFGLDATAIWRTWAMQCLKNGCLAEAREKFRLCFSRARYSSDQIKSMQSKLLAEIVSILSKSDERKLTLLQQITRIKQGIPIRSEKSRELHMTLKPTIYTECLYYIENYGTVQDQVQFYVTYCLWDKSLAAVVRNDELDKLKLYKLASRTLIKNDSSNIVADFKLLMERIRQDLQSLPSFPPEEYGSASVQKSFSFSEAQMNDICDIVIRDFISFLRDQDYQMEIAKLLSSDEAKIEFYIMQGKLSNAQRIACNLNRKDYVNKIIDEASKLNQNHVKTVCQLWLAKQTGKQ